MLSSMHQEASSVGLKRPEAEVAQLFLWLFKDNLHWEPQKAVCPSVIPTVCERLLFEIAWVYIYPCYLWVHFFSITHACVTAACLQLWNSAVF